MTDLIGDRRPRHRLRRWLYGLLLLALAWVAVVTFRVGAAPEIELDPGLPGIGQRTPVTATFRAPGRGLDRVRLELIQDGKTLLAEERQFRPRPAWALWGERTVAETLEVEVGAASVAGLREGEAVLRASAPPAPTWLRRPGPVVRELTLPVRLTPPSIGVLSSFHYVAQGGAEAVVYRVGESAVRDGVRSGEVWFPGSPLPGGGPRDRFALFAVPFDLADPAQVRLVAEDDVGNRAEAHFIDRFFERAFRTAALEITDEFMEKVVPEIVAQTPSLRRGSTLVETYLEINRELRRENAATLEALGAESRPEFLWSRPFQAMPNAKVMSAFADRRTYLYGEREIDRADHLGFDLASVRKAPVPAANSGIVALAGFFGIYGNAVVLDHGYGLQSLYGHLSSIEVEKGQTVERGQILGRSGETGLAGGDHLHFTMLLRGTAVNPIEWWDAGWIRDRLALKLGAALPFRP